MTVSYTTKGLARQRSKVPPIKDQRCHPSKIKGAARQRSKVPPINGDGVVRCEHILMTCCLVVDLKRLCMDLSRKDSWAVNNSNNSKTRMHSSRIHNAPSSAISGGRMSALVGEVICLVGVCPGRVSICGVVQSLPIACWNTPPHEQND